MYKKNLKLILVAAILLLSPVFAFAQEEGLDPDITPPEEFYLGEITEILDQGSETFGTNEVKYQVLKVKFLKGPKKDQEVEIKNDGVFGVNGGEFLEQGQKVIVYETLLQGEPVFYIADTYRLPSLITIIIIFFVIAIALSRWKGVTSILGLGITILVITKFIVPQIINGQNPVLISLAGAVIIALTSIYLAHGFNKRTTIALAGTLITLALAAGLSIVFVSMSKLFGVGSEEAFYLQFGSIESLNLQGLLLGGIILGALGVLDDITTAQAATVDELKKANMNLGFSELYRRGISVGREHISSLVNTLFLAYAGASLPLFLLFSTNVNQPVWVTLNAEFIAEELVRALVGSIALMLAVPITTALAAYFLRNTPSAESDNHSHHHHV